MDYAAIETAAEPMPALIRSHTMAAATTKAPPLPKPPTPAAPAARDTKPFTKAKNAAIGLAVLVCHAQRDALGKPQPGTVTGVNATHNNRVDVMIMHPKEHLMPATMAQNNILITFNPAALEDAAAKGEKWVAYPYDPTDPQPYIQAAPNQPHDRRPGGE
jgi:hypothetical protein